jgi:trehalose 6-phosphate phosphatase
MSAQNTSAPPPARPEWAYFLDVDGTLIDLAATPATVHVDEDLLGLLQRLRAAGQGALALVSGRSLADLAHHLPGLDMPMAGQHGLERRGGDGRLHRPDIPVQALETVRTQVADQVRRHPALLMEDKGMTLALHYRQAPFLAGHVHRLMARLAGQLGPSYTVQKGKYVAELKPAGMDKGTAIADYLAEPPFSGRHPVFIGDDANDELAFARINLQGGLSIKVGPGPSCATHRLADVHAVRNWLAVALETSS